MNSHDAVRDIGGATLKTVLPVAGWALTLNQWVAIATLSYIALQIGYLIWKWCREARKAGVPKDT